MRPEVTSPQASSSRDRERFGAIVGPVVSDAGFDLDDLVVSQAGRRRVVKVVVDGDHGVSLDDIASVSRAISAVLDDRDDDVGNAPYTLEVTSPGVERPLTTARHWRRAAGRLVRCTAAGTPIEGRVMSVDGERVTLDVAGAEQCYSLDDLSPGKVQVEFTKAPKQPKAPKMPKEPKKQKKPKGS